MDESYQRILIKTEHISEDEEGNGPVVETSKEQWEAIAEFMRSLKEMTVQEVISHWNALVFKLNKMGPPTRSSAEWRKVWTMYKSNKKRKPDALTLAEFQNVGPQVIQVAADQSSSPQPTDPFSAQNDQNSSVTYSASDPALFKLNEIVKQQKQMIKLLTAISDRQSNENISSEYRRNNRYDDKVGHKAAGRRYDDDDQHRYERSYETRRHTTDRQEFNNRHGERHRDFDDKRHDEGLKSVEQSETSGGRVTRNPFGIDLGEPRRDEYRRKEHRREGTSRSDEHKRGELPRRDAYRRNEPRRDEFRRDEPRRNDVRRGERERDNRFSDKLPAGITIKRERDNSGGNRPEDSKRRRKVPSDRRSGERDSRNVNDKRDGRRDYERDQHRKGRRPRSPSRSPAPQENRRFRRGSDEDTGNHKRGKKHSNDKSDQRAEPIDKPKRRW